MFVFHVFKLYKWYQTAQRITLFNLLSTTSTLKCGIKQLIPTLIYYILRCVFRTLSNISLREKCPYFPAFVLNTERYSECGKIRKKKTPNMATFHAVSMMIKIFNMLPSKLKKSNNQMSLIYISAIFHLYTETSEILGFRTFSWGIKMEHWAKMSSSFYFITYFWLKV